jgi:hypothetical protein
MPEAIDSFSHHRLDSEPVDVSEHLIEGGKPV